MTLWLLGMVSISCVVIICLIFFTLSYLNTVICFPSLVFCLFFFFSFLFFFTSRILCLWGLIFKTEAFWNQPLYFYKVVVRSATFYPPQILLMRFYWVSWCCWISTQVVKLTVYFSQWIYIRLYIGGQFLIW